MTEYLFRVEGVNLDATVYDTSDISSIRGGGFYLLNRINMMARQSEYAEFIVTYGASAAVFKIDRDDPGTVRKEMLKWLYTPQNDKTPVIREMMFLVEYLESKGEFPQLMARLMGKIRYAQLQSPTVRIFKETLSPGLNSATQKHFTFDSLNRVLPAYESTTSKGDVSGFTKRRRDQGVELRKTIYDKLLEKEFPDITTYHFTDDLSELANYKPNKVGNLNDKIAFIHVDGNKFGALQKDFKNSEDFEEYDKTLQRFKVKFLINTIKECCKFEAFYRDRKKPTLRLETLLWGGDEIKLIVPACMGWKVATIFFDTVAEMDLQMKGKDLTYAMGLIFTHHKNPVKNLDEMAEELQKTLKKELAESKKCEKPVYNKNYGNRMHYLVLESLETLPGGYADFAREYYNKTEPDALAFTPDMMKTMKEFVKCMETSLSRSQISAVGNAWASGDKGAYKDALQRAVKLCETKERKKLEDCIHEVIGTEIQDGTVENTEADKGFRWLQALELRDYLIWEEKTA